MALTVLVDVVVGRNAEPVVSFSTATAAVTTAPLATGVATTTLRGGHNITVDGIAFRTGTGTLLLLLHNSDDEEEVGITYIAGACIE